MSKKMSHEMATKRKQQQRTNAHHRGRGAKRKHSSKILRS